MHKHINLQNPRSKNKLYLSITKNWAAKMSGNHQVAFIVGIR